MSPVLVTGGCGFIGAEVCRRLRAAGRPVVNLDALTYAADPEAPAEHAGDPGYVFVRGDVRDREALDAVFAARRPGAVLHLAAETHVDRSIDGPGAFVRTNVEGTGVLLEAALAWWRGLDAREREAFRFVQVSTDEVFGDMAPGEVACETSPYRPRSPYAASKAGGDHLARAFHTTYGLPVQVTHGCNTYGPGQFPEKLIPLVIGKALAGETLPVYGDGLQERDWISVGDHARAVLAVLDGGRPGESWCVGSGEPRTNLEVVERVCDLLDVLAPGPAPRRDLIRFVEDRPGHDRRYALDPGKLRDRLGWRPVDRFEDGLEAVVRDALERPRWRERAAARYKGERLGLSGPSR